jgi:hypothetical protein
MESKQVFISIPQTGNWLPLDCSIEDGLSMPPKEWTLIDKHGNHLVFVNWVSHEVLSFSTDEDLSDYVVGKEYNIKPHAPK